MCARPCAFVCDKLTDGLWRQETTSLLSAHGQTKFKSKQSRPKIVFTDFFILFVKFTSFLKFRNTIKINWNDFLGDKTVFKRLKNFETAF